MRSFDDQFSDFTFLDFFGTDLSLPLFTLVVADLVVNDGPDDGGADAVAGSRLLE